MAHSDEPEGLRILSFDGGGIRGLSSLLILERIMYRITGGKTDDVNVVPRPCDYFDLIGGTSTGGLIALMLGRLRMTVADAIKAYDRLAQDVFSETKHVWQDGRFKASRLEAAIKKTVEENSPSKDPCELMKDSPVEDICRTFVCAQSADSMRGNIPVLFRTYDSPHEPAAACTIWEAARATSAAPFFFKRIEIGTAPRAEAFIDGGLGRNNPTGTLLEEAKILFPTRRVACVVSIGTGEMKPSAIPRPSMLQRVIPTEVIHVIADIATDCEATNQDMLKRFAGTRSVYFRFNVQQGMQNIKLGEWDRLAEVSAHTKQYVQQEDVAQRLGEVVNVLKERVGVIPTGELLTEMVDIR
ncbi:FabD/lysophospholipase-like protein [Mycena leptocephala]|nr:FabD/lysophospholipase-like protein [Mycena leptocephala]